EVACLCAERQREVRHLSRRAGMVRRELAAFLRKPVAPPAGRQDDGPGVEHVLATGGAPAVPDRLEVAQRGVLERGAGTPRPRVAERLRDRVPGAVADLKQALRARAPAAGKPVA